MNLARRVKALELEALELERLRQGYGVRERWAKPNALALSAMVEALEDELEDEGTLPQEELEQLERLRSQGVRRPPRP
jgi:hypothetical protein